MSESRIKSVKVGDLIEDRIYEEGGSRDAKFIVEQIFKNIVLTREKKRGTKRCFCYGDLIMKGLEVQTDSVQLLAMLKGGERRPTPRKGF